MAERNDNVWNDGELTDLRQLYAKAMSSTTIAQALNRTEESIAERVTLMRRRHTLYA